MKKILINPGTTTTSSAAPPVTVRLVLKVPEFGDRFGVKTRTVWKWLKLGMPHLKLSPRNTQIPIAEADHWVKDNFMRQRES
jgi:hypothetical protein